MTDPQPKIRWIVGMAVKADGTVERFAFDKDQKPIVIETIPPASTTGSDHT